MSESTDDNVKGVTNALSNAAPSIAQVQAGMQNGTLHKYDLSAIADAVEKLSDLREEGKTVTDLYNKFEKQKLIDVDLYASIIDIAERERSYPT